MFHVQVENVYQTLCDRFEQEFKINTTEAESPIKFKSHTTNSLSQIDSTIK